MKSSLIVRPNLKLFLMGAALLIVINDLLVGSGTQAAARTVPLVGKSGPVTDAEFERLHRHVVTFPSFEGYMRLADCYEERGDFRAAMDCLVRARLLEEALPQLD